MIYIKETRMDAEKSMVKGNRHEKVVSTMKQINTKRLKRKPIMKCDPSNESIIFKYGELYCGPGGLGLGASRAKIEYGDKIFSLQHAWASDYDPNACATYKSNLLSNNPDAVICEDVHNLDITKLDAIDAFAFGFPCNDFSVVGERKGINGKFGPLYSYGVKILNAFNPRFFLAENVSGLQNSNDGLAFEKILSDLQNAGEGYVLTPHMYKFEEYGIPQSRHRIIIVGIRKKERLVYRVPAPTHLIKYISSKEAIENPPIPSDAYNNEKTLQNKRVIERLKHIAPGENVWNANLPDNLKLNVNGAKLSMIYRRLDPDKPSYTVTGSGGGGTHIYHWKEHRALTNRERARLQTFPDEFIFEGSKESVRKQIGMAVPPKMAKLLFESILKTFAGIPYPSIKNNIPLTGMKQRAVSQKQLLLSTWT